MSDPIQALEAPAEVLIRIAQFRDALVAAAGDTLVSLVVYGSLARGRYRPGRSDINLALVLADTAPARLRAIGPALARAGRELRTEPYLLAQDELADASRSFPLTLLEIRDGGIVIAGRDVFAALQVEPRHIAIRCEQELRNRLIRARRSLALAGDDPLELWMLLRRVVIPVATDWRWLLFLRGKPAPEADDLAAILTAAVAAFQLDPALARLAEFKSSQPTATPPPVEDLRTLADSLLLALESTTRLAREQSAS